MSSPAAEAACRREGDMIAGRPPPGQRLSSHQLLLAMCRAADRIDLAAEDLSRSTADLQLADPEAVAAFARIDELMTVWHALRLVVAGMPAVTPCAAAARSSLLSPDEGEAVSFSAAQLFRATRTGFAQPGASSLSYPPQLDAMLTRKTCGAEI